MARAQCDLGDRLACDEAELEGFRPAAAPAGGASPLSVPPAPAAALALSVLLILSLLSRLLVQQRSRRPGQPGSVALPRGRRLMSAPAPTAEHAVQQQQQQPPRAAPSPRLPAVAATAAAAQRRSPTAAALVSAADTAASLLLLPVSVLQAAKYVVLGSRAATAPPATPVAPVGPSSRQGGSSGRRTVHYGLGYGEVESEEDEWEGGESELTLAALRELQQSPEFAAYLRARGMTGADVGASARKLRLYRRLRRLDPPGFRALLRPGSRTVYESREPSRLVLVAEYLVSTGASLAAAAAFYHVAWAWAGALPAAVRAVAAAVLLWLPARQWLGARPTAGALCGLFFEELEFGHAAPGWRCAAASLLELLYVAGSAGAGVPVSLAMRCSSRRQCIGELLAGVRVVQELQLTAPIDG